MNTHLGIFRRIEYAVGGGDVALCDELVKSPPSPPSPPSPLFSPSPPSPLSHLFLL